MKFYTKKELERIKKAIALLSILQWGIAVLAFVICIACCVSTTTATDRRMLITTIAASCFAGWSIILIFTLFYKPSKALYQHMASVANDTTDETVIKGRIDKNGSAIQIPNSIEIVKYRVTTENDDELFVNMIANWAKWLPTDGRLHRIKIVRSYIVEVEDA